jgi:two-component system, OmpR family, response regulator AdeR
MAMSIPKPPAALTANDRPLVLVVEDEPDLADALLGYLRHAGYRSAHAADGLAALRLFYADPPAVVLLDLMLPGLSGFEVLRTLRQSGSAGHKTPVLVLTARASEGDVLDGFAYGADDYVTKPFRPREVMARLRALLRRSQPPQTCLEGVAGLVLDPARHQAHLGGQVLELTKSEFELLASFLRAPGRVFRRQELLDARSDLDSDALERTVDAHIRNLRRKLGANHAIETVYGVGYRYGE